MQEAEFYDGLTEIFREVFLHDGLTPKPELTVKEVQGGDTFKMIEVIIAVEKKYRIKFQARELDGLRNIGDLARAVLAKTAGR